MKTTLFAREQTWIRASTFAGVAALAVLIAWMPFMAGCNDNDNDSSSTQATTGDSSGSWDVTFTGSGYLSGNSGTLQLTQTGNTVSGKFLENRTDAQGNPTVVEHDVTGMINGNGVTLIVR